MGTAHAMSWLASRGSRVACIACIASPALAKVETGTLKLDSVTTEQLIGRFGVTEKGSLTLKLTTAKKGWERGEHALHIVLP